MPGAAACLDILQARWACASSGGKQGSVPFKGGVPLLLPTSLLFPLEIR